MAANTKNSQRRWHVGLALSLLAAMLPVLGWACSSCLKQTMDPLQFDERAWRQSSTVFVALVTHAELVRLPGRSAEIQYRWETEEVFKGDPARVRRVFSARSIAAWQSGLEEGGCASVSISPGDRLLIFDTPPDEFVVIGACSASRVIEGVSAGATTDVRATLERLKRWAASP
jgi:hypothetical protein